MIDAFDTELTHRQPKRANGAGEAVPAAGGVSDEAWLLGQIAQALGRQAAREFLEQAGRMSEKEGKGND